RCRLAFSTRSGSLPGSARGETAPAPLRLRTTVGTEGSRVCFPREIEREARIAEQSQAQRGMREDVRLVRIQRQRSFDMMRRLIELLSIEQNAAKHDLHDGVPIVKFGCTPRVIVRQPFFLVPVFPGLTAPLVEMRKRKPSVSACVRRVDRQRA